MPATARAGTVLATVMVSGQRYSNADMFHELRANRVYVDWSLMTHVRKYMKHELHVDLVTEHAREYSVYYINPTPAEAQHDANYRIGRWYSEAVTMFASMTGFPNLQIQAQIMALTLGQQLGLSRVEIDADLGLAPPPAATNGASATP